MSAREWLRTDAREKFTEFEILTIASALRSISSWPVARLETLIRIAVRPYHCVPPQQQVPQFCGLRLTPSPHKRAVSK
jgi:hypothetical protein